MRAKNLILYPAIGYTIALLYLSLINLADTPVKDLGMSDKIMHTGAYFGLAKLWMIFAIFNNENRNILSNIAVVSIIAIIFGIFIEVLQDSLTSYRQLDFHDIIANSIGVIVSGIVVWLLKDSLIRLKAKINLIFTKK